MKKGGGAGTGPESCSGALSDQAQKFPGSTTLGDVYRVPTVMSRVPEVVSIISDSRLRLEMLSSIRRLYSLPACLNSHTAVSTFLR